jgi:Holliday junction resolvase RusA-like endonuclease
MRLWAEVRIYDVAIVPWSATEIGTGRTKNGRRFRFVKKEPRLETFQKHVKRVTSASMGQRKPWNGPCLLDIWICKRTEDSSLWNTWCFVPEGGAGNLRGDLTNLVKSIEDGLKGVAFRDDTLVCAGQQMVIWGATDTIIAKVYTLEGPPRPPLEHSLDRVYATTDIPQA